jgi:hypothetical protein
LVSSFGDGVKLASRLRALFEKVRIWVFGRTEWSTDFGVYVMFVLVEIGSTSVSVSLSNSSPAVELDSFGEKNTQLD